MLDQDKEHLHYIITEILKDQLSRWPEEIRTRGLKVSNNINFAADLEVYKTYDSNEYMVDIILRGKVKVV